MSKAVAQSRCLSQQKVTSPCPSEKEQFCLIETEIDEVDFQTIKIVKAKAQKRKGLCQKQHNKYGMGLRGGD